MQFHNGNYFFLEYKLAECIDNSLECLNVHNKSYCNDRHINGNLLSDECPSSCGTCNQSSICERNSPCLNNGKCLDTNTSYLRYKCVCSSGYSGYLCEKS